MKNVPRTPWRDPGMIACAVLLIVSSVLVATGMHRLLYDAGRWLALPPLGVSFLAGALNLSWYEIAYAVGGGLKMVRLFLAIPPVGAATGMLSGVLLLLGVRFARHVLLAHIALSITLGFLSLCVLLWRLYRGMSDPWRILTTLTFIAAYAALLAYFRRAERTAGRAAAHTQAGPPLR
ncbi:MAG TPA: hypothetical protein VMM80_03170 [Bacteroidota bacterium]|nr:hypothetical protein [Bacteroidota bacterium]